jgi:hypothetical protein
VLHVPARFATILVAFAPVFVQARPWRHAQMLILGALLVAGQQVWAWSDIQPLRGHAVSRMASKVADLRRN